MPNVDTHRQLHELFNRRDWDALGAHLREDVTFTDMARGLTMKSIDDVKGWLGEWATAFSGRSPPPAGGWTWRSARSSATTGTGRWRRRRSTTTSSRSWRNSGTSKSRLHDLIAEHDCVVVRRRALGPSCLALPGFDLLRQGHGTPAGPRALRLAVLPPDRQRVQPRSRGVARAALDGSFAEARQSAVGADLGEHPPEEHQRADHVEQVQEGGGR